MARVDSTTVISGATSLLDVRGSVRRRVSADAASDRTGDEGLDGTLGAALHALAIPFSYARDSSTSATAPSKRRWSRSRRRSAIRNAKSLHCENARSALSMRQASPAPLPQSSRLPTRRRTRSLTALKAHWLAVFRRLPLANRETALLRKAEIRNAQRFHVAQIGPRGEAAVERRLSSPASDRTVRLGTVGDR